MISFSLKIFLHLFSYLNELFLLLLLKFKMSNLIFFEFNFCFTTLFDEVFNLLLDLEISFNFIFPSFVKLKQSFPQSFFNKLSWVKSSPHKIHFNIIVFEELESNVFYRHIKKLTQDFFYCILNWCLLWTKT
jgi:hypothetical protein